MFSTYSSSGNRIMFRRGDSKCIDNNPLLEGEIAYVTDIDKFYIGTRNGNLKFKRMDLVGKYGLDIKPLKNRFYIGLTELGMHELYKSLDVK